MDPRIQSPKSQTRQRCTHSDRDAVGLGMGATGGATPRKSLQAFAGGIYPLRASDNQSSDSFLSFSSTSSLGFLPLPPYFFRRKASRSSKPESKSKTSTPSLSSISDTMSPPAPSFLRKMFSTNASKESPPPHDRHAPLSQIRSSKKHPQSTPATSIAITSSCTEVDSGYGSSFTYRISSESNISTTSSCGSSSECSSGLDSVDDRVALHDGVEREDFLHARVGDPFRKLSIQSSHTVKASHRRSESTPPALGPSTPCTNPFASQPPEDTILPVSASVSSPTVAPRPSNGSRRNPRPAYNLSDFLATRRASALMCPPDQMLGRGRSKATLHPLSPSDPSPPLFHSSSSPFAPSPAAGAQTHGAHDVYARRPSYPYNLYGAQEVEVEVIPVSLPVPPWHKRRRRADVVYEPDAELDLGSTEDGGSLSI